MKKSQNTPYIAFAGCEGSGKSTQLEYAKKLYPNALFTREPGGSEYSENVLRPAMLKSSLAKQASPFTHLCSMMGACHDTLRNVVVPALEEGKVVITDRSAQMCAFAYEVYGMQGMHLRDTFFKMKEECLNLREPDIYILFDISPEEGMRRVSKRRANNGEFNHLDDRGVKFHERVRAGYLEYARLFPDKVKIIDAHKSVEDISLELEKILRNVLD